MIELEASSLTFPRWHVRQGRRVRARTCWTRLPVVSEQQDSCAAVIQLLQDVEGLLKEPRLALDFGRHGVNTSLALVAVQGLIAYLDGDKAGAADDLGTAAEEIRARLEGG